MKLNPTFSLSRYFILANRWYASLGCWKDTESSSVSSLEGSDSLLQGSYLKRDKPIDTCAQVARKHDYKGKNHYITPFK